MPIALPQLGPVKPHVKEAAQVIAEEFGVTNIAGFATTGHIPDSDHYKGLALDVMTSDKSLGDQINNWILRWGPKRWGVTYTIWYRTYYEPGGVSKPYTGSSPHTDHVHISFSGEGGTGHNAGIPGFEGGNPVSAMLEYIEENALRVAMFVGGGVLLLVGIVYMRKGKLL